MTQDILNTQNNNTGMRQHQAQRAVNLGLFFNSLLAVTKLIAGIFGHSQALLADGINSVSDVIYLIVVKIFVKLSGKPADREHPYGHHQYESIAALVIGAFVITTGAAIFWDSVNTAYDLYSGVSDARPIRLFALYVALFTVIAKLFLMLNAKTVATKTGNIAINALARDHRNDIFSSLGATTGILLGILGKLWFDPVAGAVVSLVVAKTGFDILREASSDLMDNIPGDELEKQIRQLLAGFDSILDIEDIHAHRFGPYFVVNLTIAVDGGLSVAEGDKIADKAEELLTGKIEMLRKVYVHYHPKSQK